MLSRGMPRTPARHPRTLAEAFPAERWAAVEVHRSHWREWVRAGLFLAFLFAVLFGTHFVATYIGA
jgi:hypothetical protein